MNVNYDSARDIKQFLDEQGLGMRKKFGQNFLINPAVRKNLINALGAERGDEVWEIGPGIGAMTRGLLDIGVKVTAFEIDPGFIRVLKGLFEGESGFSLVEGDVMKTWKSREKVPYLLGNLPYNIGAALLGDFIEARRLFRRAVVTVQKEVSRRMAARSAGEDYSSFSVLCASVYTVKPLMIIKGSSFYPAPRVDSQGVVLDLKDKAEIRTCPDIFYPLVRALFASRRKTVKNNLRTFLSSAAFKNEGEQTARELLEACGISPMERSENLRLDDFICLAAALEKKLIRGKDYNDN
jgi:16S rRNA (adenine1518-N6/adenine1519-N6)-dimethyltransferase